MTINDDMIMMDFRENEIHYIDDGNDEIRLFYMLKGTITHTTSITIMTTTTTLYYYYFYHYHDNNNNYYYNYNYNN